ncbi:MAG: M23 family metallopeptidase [Pseudomonadota bacterium]
MYRAGTALALFALALMQPTSGQAQDLRLTLPVDCEMGATCFIEDYVDQDPAEGQQRDFACGINSRDGHKGTDIAILSFDALEAGVDVLAAAPGVVLRLRDEMPDDRLMRGVTSENACGNGLIIRHDDGWQTQYCHLKLGSISVARGERVEAGDVIGEIGLSGQTNHPHLHFNVFRDGDLVDPFRPHAFGSCGPVGASLWTDPPTYHNTGLVTAGFSDRVPSLDEVTSGAARIGEGRSGAPLVVYAHAGYAQPGDVLRLTATGPEGDVFARDIVLEDPKVSQMQAFGRRAPEGGWPVGEYLGEAWLIRDGTVMAHRFTHLTVVN